MGVKAKSYTPRPAGFDGQVIACLPKLTRMASRLTYRDNREDLVNSTVERALRLWSQQGDYKIDVWLIYMMRAIAHEERLKAAGLPIRDGALERQTVPADQDEIAAASILTRAVEASPHADVVGLVAQGFTSEEIATMRGVSRQRVHQKITAFRRANSALVTKEEFA